MIGRTLSHYRIVEKIGAGGMGEVYRARDERLERDVALKVLPTGTLSDEAARKHFRKEALTLSKLNHPNIATVFDFDTQDGVDFLVMELVEGVTLSDKLAVGPLREKEITRLGAQMAEGLAAAHEQRVVHRDLKPANLRVTPDGRLKILDFGLAKLVRPDVTSATAPTESFTETQGVAGTLPYMAPEQLQGEQVDARTDIHALGAVLYEMATGQRPFPETQGPRLIAAILNRAPQPPSGLNRRVSGELERITLKCLEKEPENRYQSAKEVEVDLRRLKRDTDSGRAAVAGAGGLRAATKKRWKVLAPAAALVAVLAGAAVWQFRSAHALTEEDFILLTDFTNTTGEPIFDGTLKQALTVKLEESPFLNIVPERRVQETLGLMERSPDERLTPALAQEICERQGVKAMVEGSIARLGRNYIISLNATNCRTGDSLAREQVEAESKEEVLAALGKAASRLRRELGESLASIEQFDKPLEEATTSSLEALKALSLSRERRKEGEAEAIPFLKRAIELDPNFALAHAILGTVYLNLWESERSTEHYKKAYELRHRVTEWEKFYIEAWYYTEVTGDLRKAKQTYEIWRRTYPRKALLVNLAVIYNRLGQYDKAAETGREVWRSRPKGRPAPGPLARSYASMNRFEEAKAIAETRGRQRPGAGAILLYEIAFVQGDSAAMQRHSAVFTGGPREHLMLSLQAQAAASAGRLEEARKLDQRSVDTAQRLGSNEVAADVAAHFSVVVAELGNHRLARERAAAALSLGSSPHVQELAALALARSGDIGRAQALADDLSKRFPADTIMNALSLPAIRGTIEIERGNPAKAIELLEAAVPYELSQYNMLSAVYVRGRAYLSAGQSKEAAGEFQKILDHRGIAGVSVLPVLAQLGLARAYSLAGDTTQSHRAYEDFLALWKDADPDVPIFQEAKAEYAKLREFMASPSTN